MGLRENHFISLDFSPPNLKNKEIEFDHLGHFQVSSCKIASSIFIKLSHSSLLLLLGTEKFKLLELKFNVIKQIKVFVYMIIFISAWHLGRILKDYGKHILNGF